MEIFLLGVILTSILSGTWIFIMDNAILFSKTFRFNHPPYITRKILKISLLILGLFMGRVVIIIAWKLFISLDVLQGIKTLFFL